MSAQSPIDQYWHEKLAAIKGVRPVHAYLPNMRGNSRIGYKPAMWEAAKVQLHALRTDICQNEANDVIRCAYLAVIDEQLTKGKLLEAAWQQDIATFREANKALYGMIDPLLWEACGAYLARRLRLRSRRHSVANSSIQWPERILSTNQKLRRFLPKQSRFLQIQHAYRQLPWVTRFADLLPDTPFLTVTQVAELCTHALHDVLGDSTMKVVIKQSAVFRMRIAQQRRLLIYGNDTMQLSRRRVLALALYHEIGTHAIRRKQSNDVTFALLKSGADMYELGEEGLGVLAEQLTYASIRSSMRSQRFLTIVLRYYAAGLLEGLGGEEFSSSRATQRHVREFYAAWFATWPKYSPETITKYAKLHTKVLFTSLLRGVGHNDQRAYYGRAATYLPGYIMLLQLLAVSDIEIASLFVGHFNPLRAEHRQLLASHVTMKEKVML